MTYRVASRIIVHMPATHPHEWRRLREELDLTSDEAAATLKITGGALRMIEAGRRPASRRLAYRAARLYSCQVGRLLVDADPPDQPKEEPRVEPKVEPTAPPPRRNGKSGRGPRRDEMKAAS